MMYDESVASRAGISDFRRRQAEAELRRGRGDLYGDFGVLKLQQPAQRVPAQRVRPRAARYGKGPIGFVFSHYY